MHIILFDDKPSALTPFTLMMPSWDVPLGGSTLREVLKVWFPHAALEEHFGPFHPTLARGASALAISGRLLPSQALYHSLQQAMEGGRPMRALIDDEVAYAVVVPNEAGLQEHMAATGDGVTLLRMPWDIIKHLDKTLQLSVSFKSRVLSEIQPGVFIGEGVTLPPYLITRTENGPIVIGAHTQIGSFSVLEGPLVVGERCVIRDHSAIAASAIGHVSKVGGEIEHSVIDAYSNKQHHGFVGHSIVGSWVNIGAGACTSNLKHTYGTVRVDRGFGKEETGTQFCGCFIGESSRVSINANLMAGAVLGVSTFVIGMAHGFIPSFTAVTPRGMVEIPFDTAWRARQRAMARRGMSPSVTERDRFATLYERTTADRAMRGVRSGPIQL